MIQDIAPHHYDVRYSPMTPKDSDLVLCFDQNSVLRKESDLEIHYPTLSELQIPEEKLRYLFSIDGKHLFLHIEQSAPTLPGYKYYPLQDFRQAKPQHLAFVSVTAAHLYRWYQCHRFCGACATVLKPSEIERAMVCPNCGHLYYPQIAPAVIVAVTDGDKIVLSRYSDRPLRNYALLAGYCEIGESVEQTIHREVMEEVGLEVTNLRYYKSQPWGFTDTLLMGFYCDVSGSREIHIDETELEEASWVTREDLTFATDEISLTQEMIRVFHEGREPK